MNTTEEILKELNTPKGKATMDKWIDEFIAKTKARNEKIETMMSNTNYIEWLNSFTKDKEKFADDDWVYCPEKLDETDREKVSMLSMLYEGIEKYALENYIFPTPCDFGEFYRVKLNDFTFEVGIMVGQGTIFFFNKTSLEDGKDFIDFNDVITKTKKDNVDQINSILDSLSKMVVSAYENGVPIEAIINTLNETIEDITSKKEDKSKSLVRK